MFPTLVAAALAASAPAQGVTLTGVVQNTTGHPLPKATVFIRTAAPRTGIGVL
jgi:hypothetical protein